MKTAVRITISAIAAATLMFFVGWETILFYGRHVGFHDVQRDILTIVGGGVVMTGLLTWGFYRIVR